MSCSEKEHRLATAKKGKICCALASFGTHLSPNAASRYSDSDLMESYK